jgi:hypothetical protein
MEYNIKIVIIKDTETSWFRKGEVYMAREAKYHPDHYVVDTERKGNMLGTFVHKKYCGLYRKTKISSILRSI